jgi:hypothetical protein
VIFLEAALTLAPCRYSSRRTNVQQGRLSRSILTLKSSILVDDLFFAVEQEEEAATTTTTTTTTTTATTTKTATPETDQTIIPSLIQQLENIFQADPNNKDADALSRFDSLVGYYNVSYTLTSRAKGNPVGGK